MARVPAGLSAPVRLLFVCLGNLCRSPTAEGVMRHRLEVEGLTDRVELDSAGTGAWHVGEPPDARAAAAASEHGVVLAGEGRQVEAADFDAFDLLLAMDRSNARDLRALAPDDAGRDRVRLLREFDPAAVAAGALDVPDPYLGEDGFEHVFELVDAGCRGLLAELRASGRL